MTRTIPLRRTSLFSAVYRRGRWARGVHLSIGSAPNRLSVTRVGLRTRKGLKGAVQRNRLRRQLREVIYTRQLPLSVGVDVVVVIHPARTPFPTQPLAEELVMLCKRLGILSPHS